MLHERWLAGPALEAFEMETDTAAANAAIRQVAATVPDSVMFLPRIPPPPVREINPLGGPLSQYADLFVRVGANGDLGGAWQKQRPCDVAFRINCNPGLMPQLRPEVQFNMRIGGTISERVHIDIDYDQTREFDAANNINVFYQGLTDEPLQRIDVGDVSINLPSSRFMTRAIPAGNFGMRFAGAIGPAQFQTVFAQQKGDVTSKEFKFGGGRTGVEQDATLAVDDADYVTGQFFFLLRPQQIRGYPHIDALQMRFTDASANIRPAAGGSIQVYRDERLGSQPGSNGQLGYFLACAATAQTGCGAQLPPAGVQRHTGLFRRLEQDKDYIVHASGLWIMLRSPLRQDEALAISYVTESGDTVGVLDAESSPPGTTPRLQLLRGPFATHQPGAPTWDLEMHQVYRLDSSSDVELSTIDLRISLGELSGGRTFRDVGGKQPTFLKFFGLDEDSPVDRIDGAQVFRPARDAASAGATTPIGGTYVIFPTLRPFAEPAPVPSAQLSAEELELALGADANIDIYENPDPVDRLASGRFRLNFQYRGRVEGVVSSFNLGGFGLRENSERLTLEGRTLERGTDYEIDYEIGMVTLLNASELFATSPDAEIRARFEQKAQFSIAPTSIAGSTLRFDLGQRGELNLVGLFQSERSLMNRPSLGVEPGSSFLGGMSGRFQLGGGLLDRVLNNGLGLRSTTRSAVTLTGELAFSQPNPNRVGVGYLDDFESSDENQIELRRQFWKLGSAPQSTDGDRGTLPFTRNASTATSLTWQHELLGTDGSIAGAELPSRIDQQITTIGNEQPESVMWLRFNERPLPNASPVERRRWRSITTVLSTTGLDMSRTEYLEFYVAAGTTGKLALVFDIGTVSEDAFYVDSLGNTTGSFDDGRRWGLGELDEEARLAEREVWGVEADQRGLWNQSCLAAAHTTYALGDPRVNCTRSNGINNTEDLNGNAILDPDDGQHFRYVVQLDQLSEYLVRDVAATGTLYRLYRIPLRTGTSINGANDATWRFIRHLRMTLAGEPESIRDLRIARMRIIGSRWTKRDVHGVQRGFLDEAPGISANTAEITAGPVSKVTDGNRYAAPPGIVEEVQDPTQQYGSAGQEINEKSLRLKYVDLEAGDRAEIYYRYPQQSRDMLMYGEMRLWVLPRAGNWGPGGEERFTVRVGSDPRNFYLFQSKLHTPSLDTNAKTTDWLPELIIDVQQWLNLRAEAERRVVERTGSQVTRVDTVWSADSAYAIVLQDRARAPNLAAVRELIFSVYNGGTTRTSGEVWIDDMRVSRPNRDAGGAGNLNLNVVAGELVNANFTLTRQGPMFRQLNENPTYQQGTDLSIVMDAHLDRLLPTGWGIDLPLTISHNRAAQAPRYLQQTDVLADRLVGLRPSGNDGTRVGLRLSKSTPTANPWLSLLLDGSVIRVSYLANESRSVLSTAQTGGFNGDYSYRRDLVPRTFGAMPGFIAGMLRSIAPAAIEKSDPFTRLLASKFRWSPATVSMGTSYNDQLARTYRFDRILQLPGDSAVAPIESPVTGLRNDALIGLQPFTALTMSVSMSSARDLLDSERATTQQLERIALERARATLGGMDIGWEANRALVTTLNYRPQITSWLDMGYTFDNRYLTDRSPSYLELDETGTDTVAEMQRRFEATRSIARTIQLRPKDYKRGPVQDSAAGLLHRIAHRIDLIDLTWRNSLSSQFERETFTPGASYQFGLGGFDAFRAIGADTAVRAQERHDFTANSNIALFKNASFTAGYRSDESESFDPRGGNRTLRTTEWPKTRFFVRDVTLPESFRKYVTTLGGSFGLDRIERATIYAGNEAQSRGTTELRFPFQLNVGLPKSFRVSYRGNFSTGETLDPTGNAESAGRQQEASVSGVIPAPERWKAKLTAPIFVMLSYVDTQQRQCRFNQLFGADDGCIRYIDSASKTTHLKLSSMIRDIELGVSMDYSGRDSRIGLRNGSSQFQLGLFGRFNFTAGVQPDGVP